MASIPTRQLLSQEPQAAASGSRTITTTPGPSSAPGVSSDPEHQQEQPTAILRLQGANTRDSRNVQWAEGVVDNEGMNRKKSKVCCIYHRPRAVDESSNDSSSSDSDSSSSSDEDSDDGRATRGDADQAFRGRAGGANNNRRRAAHHRHAPDCPDHDHDDSGMGSSSDEEGPSGGSGRPGNNKGKGKGKGKRRPSPNAYEKVPRYGKPSTNGA